LSNFRDTLKTKNVKCKDDFCHPLQLGIYADVQPRPLPRTAPFPAPSRGAACHSAPQNSTNSGSNFHICLQIQYTSSTHTRKRTRLRTLFIESLNSSFVINI